MNHRALSSEVRALPRPVARVHGRWALLWSALTYASFAAHVLGWIPLAASSLLIVITYARYFSHLHERTHAKGGASQRRSDPRSMVRWAPVVVSPLMVDAHALGVMHHEHHRHHRARPQRDPDGFIGSRPFATAALLSLVQPEVYLFEHLRRGRRKSPQRGAVAINVAYLLAIDLLAGPGALLSWLLMTRAANAVAWLMFSWVLHNLGTYGDAAPLIQHRVIARAWRVVLGPVNYWACMHHDLHHRYPFVSSTALPRVARLHPHIDEDEP